MWIVIPIVLLLIACAFYFFPACRRLQRPPRLQGALGNILVGAALTLMATSAVEQWKKEPAQKRPCSRHLPRAMRPELLGAASIFDKTVE
jgi:hypothetical protein